MPDIRKSSPAGNEFYEGQHRFEHWYRDNQVYFITARCRDRFPSFETVGARQVFWDRFDHYTGHFGFTPWVTSLLNNHYHTLGYLKLGENLGPMMQRIHGSVAKLVNDLIEERGAERLSPFWVDKKHSDYMDGCIRDEAQARRAYRYVLTQSVRHGLAQDWKEYPDTHVRIDVDRAVKRALELDAFLTEVGYPRYQRKRRSAREQGR
jgi:hypothetical protein